MKYKKKPVVIEAFQYDGDLKDKDSKWYVPQWAIDAYEQKILMYGPLINASVSLPSELFITMQGLPYHVSVGDYIIKGVQGEIYPCKPDIFEQTYEPVDDAHKYLKQGLKSAT